MKIIVSNVTFDFDLGCRLLKLKDNECQYEQLEDFWDDIIPLDFASIAQITNLEQRRVAIGFLGIDQIVEQANPKLIDSQTLSKTTTWVNESGELETFDFDDTYDLYEIDNRTLFDDGSSRNSGKSYYVSCKDTSTDRNYMIWVDAVDVFTNNNKGENRWSFDVSKVNAIQCIAWTITTNIAKGNIERIIRQGDCILIKPIDVNADRLETQRHLTEDEYRTLLDVES